MELIIETGASLVAQQWRLHLARQDTWVPGNITLIKGGKEHWVSRRKLSFNFMSSKITIFFYVRIGTVQKTHFWFVHWGGVYRDCISACSIYLSVAFFSPLWRRCSANFQIFFGGDCFICSCRFTAFIEGGELRISLCHQREPCSLKLGFPESPVCKESASNAGDPSSIPGLGWSAGEGIGYPPPYSWASLAAHLVKNTPALRETWVRSLGWEDTLEKGKSTHSSILAWRIPWTVYSMGSQRVRHHWVNFIFTNRIQSILSH